MEWKVTDTPKKPKLTRKQAEFVKGIAEGKPATISAQDTYNVKNYGTAAVIASENLNKPNVKEAIDLAMVKLNLTPERVLKPIDDALNDDDVKTRLMGTDRALKLMGATGKQEGAPININFNQHIQEQRDKYQL